MPQSYISFQSLPFTEHLVQFLLFPLSFLSFPKNIPSLSHHLPFPFPNKKRNNRSETKRHRISSQSKHQIKASNQIKKFLITLSDSVSLFIFKLCWGIIQIRSSQIMSSSSAAFSLDHITQSPSEQLCYVHCNFCDTILAVHPISFLSPQKLKKKNSIFLSSLG